MRTTLRSLTISLPLLTGAILTLPFNAVAADPQTAVSRNAALVQQQSYADLVDRVAPAVVTIRSARRVRAPQQFNFFDDPFFRQFFGDRGRNMPRQNPQQQEEHALGSG